jgi:hypothetical protein
MVRRGVVDIPQFILPPNQRTTTIVDPASLPGAWSRGVRVTTIPPIEQPPIHALAFFNNPPVSLREHRLAVRECQQLCAYWRARRGESAFNKRIWRSWRRLLERCSSALQFRRQYYH